MSQSIREFMGIGAQGIGASQTAQRKGLRETFKEFFKPENLKKNLIRSVTPFSGVVSAQSKLLNPKPNVQEAFELFDRPNPGGLMMADNPLVQQGIEKLKNVTPIAQLFAGVGPTFQNAAAFLDEKFGSGNIPKAYGGAMPDALGGGIYVPSPESVIAGVDNEFLKKVKLQDDYATPLFHELTHLAIEGKNVDPSYKTGTGGIAAGSEELPVMLSDAIYGQGGVNPNLVQSGFATPEGQITQEGVAALQGQNLPRPTMEALGMAPENPNLMSGPFQISDIQQSLLPQYQLDRRKQFEQDLADFQRDYASNMALLGGSQPVSSSGISDLYRFFDPRLNPFTTKYSGIGMNFDLPQLSSTSSDRMGLITDYSFRSPTAPTTFDPSGLQLSPGALDYFGQNYQIGM